MNFNINYLVFYLNPFHKLWYMKYHVIYNFMEIYKIFMKYVLKIDSQITFAIAIIL